MVDTTGTIIDMARDALRGALRGAERRAPCSTGASRAARIVACVERG
jgi:hypothetical protein